MSDINIDEWDGEEKRNRPGVNEHMMGLRKEISEIKIAMREMATALRQLAVLEEKHTGTRELALEVQSDVDQYKDKHNVLERTVSFYKGALFLMGFLLTLGGGSIGVAIVKGFDALTEAKTHIQMDQIRTPQDVWNAITAYHNVQKGIK